jgi:hypothetical protein
VHRKGRREDREERGFYISESGRPRPQSLGVPPDDKKLTDHASSVALGFGRRAGCPTTAGGTPALQKPHETNENTTATTSTNSRAAET